MADYSEYLYYFWGMLGNYGGPFFNFIENFKIIIKILNT